MTYKTGPGGHEPDGTGPHGRGNGPGSGRADCSGMDATRDSSNSQTSVRGPGGNLPDGRGTKGAGKGMGSGSGQEDGSGLEAIARQNGWKIGSGAEFVISTKNYGVIQSEYSSIYSVYGHDKKVESIIAKAHNDAVNEGYEGEERREYVKKQIKELLGDEASTSNDEVESNEES